MKKSSGQKTAAKSKPVRVAVKGAKTPAARPRAAAKSAPQPTPAKSAKRLVRQPVPKTPAGRPGARPAAKPAPVEAKRPAAPAKTPAPARPAAPAKLANGTHPPTGNGPGVKPNPNGTVKIPGKPLPPKLADKASAAKPAAPKPPVLTPRVETVIPADKDLSVKGSSRGGPVKDRIVMMVPDPFWLHAYWELSYQSIQRAEAALGQDWHGARPIIRLFDVTSQDTTSTSEAPLRDIVIHGGCTHWYIDVPQPPRKYRADIGYLSRRGQFYVLARSNEVMPPKAGASEELDEGWASELDGKAAERILAMSSGFESGGGKASPLATLFEEQFGKPSKEHAFGTGAVLPDKLKKFGFELGTELIVFGKTDPSAHVTLQNEPVKLRGDGTFTMRYTLTDGRQIIPAVATSSDGMEERTIVLAVERNTKHLDPMTHDLYAES